jgi:ribosome-associated translation inhibitor RaiA
MHIQVNSGSSIEVDEDVIRAADSVARGALGRYEQRLTRLEIHLSDSNAQKGGAQDKRCQIEARPAGHEPLSASNDAPTVDAAIRGAVHKMERLLEHSFGRLADRHRDTAEQPLDAAV